MRVFNSAERDLGLDNVEHMIALWHNTLREDRWVTENHHHGIMSSRYAYKTGQPYMATEGGWAGATGRDALRLRSLATTIEDRAARLQ